MEDVEFLPPPVTIIHPSSGEIPLPEGRMLALNDHPSEEKIRMPELKTNFFYQQNPFYHLVDALPYFDPLSSEVEQEVKCLIEEEMKIIMISLNDKDTTEVLNENNGKFLNSLETQNDEMKKITDKYLKNFPLPFTPHLDEKNSLIGKELTRCMEEKPMEKLDFESYNDLDKPTSVKGNDLDEWKRHIERLECVSEYSANSVINLELMLKFCKKAWPQHVRDHEVIKNSLSKELLVIQNKVEQINKRRKLEQIECGNFLRNAQRDKDELVKRNNEASAAVIDIDQEVSKLIDLCKLRGILPEKFQEDGNGGFTSDHEDNFLSEFRIHEVEDEQFSDVDVNGEESSSNPRMQNGFH